MPKPPFSVKGVPLNEAIRQRRLTLGITQAELARRMGRGTTGRHIHRLESSGKYMPSWIRLQRMALALKLPKNALLKRNSRSENIDP
jgi:transcriptional regulator with XRE-family HTH domain